MRKRTSYIPSHPALTASWPHQVALHDDLCVMQNYQLIAGFCREHGLSYVTRSVIAVWSGQRQEQYRLYCFRDGASAIRFQAYFGGYLFDPKKDREGGRVRGVWLQEGEYERTITSGPLSVPEPLRR